MAGLRGYTGHMKKITKVNVLSDYRVDLAFADGTKGVVDLSDMAGRGVFDLWNDYAEFEKARIGENGELIWSDQIDLCPDALYLQVSGKKPHEIFPSLNREPADA